MKTSPLILSFFALFILSSCGVDKLKSKSITNQSGLSVTGLACSCTSAYSPVCGNDGKDYDNTCLAKCFGTTIKNIGHCNCQTNLIPVCGIDGIDHSECDARSANIEIVKFIPCAASGI